MVNRWRKTGKYYWSRPRGRGFDNLQILYHEKPYKIVYKESGSYWAQVGKVMRLSEAEKIASDFRRTVS